MNHDQKRRSTVAQIGNLPWRRMAFGEARKVPNAVNILQFRGLTIRDTAECHSALLPPV